MIVRPARPEELTAVGLLCERAYAAAGHLADDDGYAPTLRDAVGRAAAGTVLVAESANSGLVGTVSLCPAGSAFAELARPGELELRFLAVDPRAWRRGVGRVLVEAADDAAAAAGDRALVLFVIEWNDAAHRMYAGLGFTRVPARDWEPAPGVVLEAYHRTVRAAGRPRPR